MQHHLASEALRAEGAEHFPVSRSSARRRPARRLGGEGRPLSLALQGGGSFGAFTWGVLDRLLEEDGLALDTVSGTSAGAVNAVLLAAGLLEGGPEAARAKLARFWLRLAEAAPAAKLGMMAPVMAFSRSALGQFSPYQFNPLGIDPLRALLAQEVDFAALRRHAPIGLMIAATRVRDGSGRLFREDEITLEAVLASACLPYLHHAVEIEGEAYWDGAFTANPPLRALALESQAEHILLVQIAPRERLGVPRLTPEITRRSREIAFSAPLQHEIEQLEELKALCSGRGLFRPKLCKRLDRLRLHRIAAEDSVDGLAKEDPMDVSRPLLDRLAEHGRAAGGAWLAAWR